MPSSSTDVSSNDNLPMISFPSRTLRQVLSESIAPLGIPAWYGSAIGHVRHNFTVPLGVEVEVDAERGTILMLEPAVV